MIIEKKTIILLLLLISVTFSYSQITKDDIDTLFSIAREKANGKKYEEAREVLYKILSVNPNQTDAKIFIARTYAWQEKYDSAKVYIKNVLQGYPEHYEALNTLIDIHKWEHNFYKALEITEKALKIFPDDSLLLMEKTKILRQLNNKKEAIATLDHFEELYNSTNETQEIRKEIISSLWSHSMAINFATDIGQNALPMHYAFLQYGHKTNYGPIYARLNFSKRFSKQGLQLELDCYPSIFEKSYLYLSYGFSKTILFPEHRINLELYSNLINTIEASIGFRYLYFNKETSVKIYTGTVGYYWRDFWFSLRPYIIPQKIGSSKNLSFTTRYFLGNPDEYIQIRAGLGFIPDERLIQTSQGENIANIYYLGAKSAGLGLQKIFSINYMILFTFDLTDQETTRQSGHYEKIYNIALTIYYRF